MAIADAATLATLAPLLRQLREIKGLKEVRPGSFQCRGAAFLQFQQGEPGGAPFAELKKAGGAGVERYALATPPDQRKLVEDARRRAAKLGDDD